jgi:hypothetical protein
MVVEEHESEFLETSTVTNEGLKELFEMIARKVKR